ncbi:MAG: serine--tRNA ligase [Proteobacteria bacterium]|nr:serine--tRNA ligase [Pseudomonadota bacterium]
MHDIKFIRDNPDAFDAALKRRGLPKAASAILLLDEERRAIQTELQHKQNQRNTLSKEIAEVKKSGDSKSAEKHMAKVAGLKSDLAALETKERDIAARLESELLQLPNMVTADVPAGTDENDNEEIRTWGTPPSFPFPAKDHVALGEGLGLMDFALAAKLSGARFVVLKGALSRLERAIASFMLDVHTREFGYSEFSPPYLVKRETMQGTGQLPKFAEDLFTTSDDRWLIPTAEVPLTSLVADSILEEGDLPMRLTAYTPCFRAEAGAAGKDTRGMIRQHQFSKVELVSITHPDESDKELERMTSCAEAILQRLELPYRVVKLCCGDIGFAARTTYDLEVWLPGQEEGKGKYREISSCSNCGDFQTRRMRARFRSQQSQGKKQNQNIDYVHSLNGSGLAVGRCLLAVMENYQTDHGTIRVPTALIPYMQGMTEIDKEMA